MTNTGSLVLYWLGCAFLGAIPFALLLGRLRGVDIRAIGSGNIGATNLTRALGLPWGGLALFLDAGKGAGPVLLGLHWFGEARWVGVVGGAWAVMGHCFSPYLRFRGGKGVATTVGVLAALDYRILLGLTCIWGALVWWLRNIGVASTLTAMVGTLFGAWLLLSTRARMPDGSSEGVDAVAIMLIFVSLLVILRHRKNILSFVRGILAGAEK